MAHKHLPLLQYLSKGKPRIVKAIVEESDPQVIKAICECCLNVLNNNVPLKPGEFKKLKRYKKLLRLLADKKVSLKRKKQVIQKGGAFLSTLLGVAVPAIASLLSGIIKK